MAKHDLDFVVDIPGYWTTTSLHHDEASAFTFAILAATQTGRDVEVRVTSNTSKGNRYLGDDVEESVYIIKAKRVDYLMELPMWSSLLFRSNPEPARIIYIIPNKDRGWYQRSVLPHLPRSAHVSVLDEKLIVAIPVRDDYEYKQIVDAATRRFSPNKRKQLIEACCQRCEEKLNEFEHEKTERFDR